MFDQAYWSFRNKYLTKDEIFVETKYSIPISTKDEMDSKDKYYISLSYEEWCDLLYTLEDKDNRKMDAAHIKIISKQRNVLDSNGNVRTRLLHKKKDSTGVLLSRKENKNKTPYHKGNQIYCVLSKKVVMTEHKCILYSSET